MGDMDKLDDILKHVPQISMICIDVAKACGAGADFVMLGGMLAGHEECTGEVIQENGDYFKVFYGMSSDTAMKKHAGGVAEYRSSEGKTVKVPYRGPVDETIRDIL